MSGVKKSGVVKCLLPVFVATIQWLVSVFLQVDTAYSGVI